MGRLARLCHFIDPDNDSAIEKRHRSVKKSSLGLRCPKFIPGTRSASIHESMAYKVLVIEDNTDCRELFAMLIRHFGFHVVEADDGEIGVQKAMAEKPDLIFMDIAMPSMNGIQATSCLRKSAVTRQTPIIICTAWTAQAHKDTALHRGADAVINKPVSLRELQTVLLHYLPRPSDELNVQ